MSQREIDLNRVINLMYSGSFHENGYEMTKVDETYQKAGWICCIITTIHNAKNSINHN